MMAVSKPWTEEETATLLAYWYRCLPATAIAPLLGRTRSAVLARLFRLGEQRKSWGREKAPPKVRERVARVAAPPVRYNGWSEESLTEKWADRKERLQRERAQQTA
jgi:hypothetical protein